MTTGSATGGPAVVHAAAQSTVRARAERVAGPLAAAWAALQVELALLQSRWPNESGAVRARRARLLAVHARDSMDVLDASLDGSVQAAVDGTYDAATDVAAAAVPAGQQPVGRPSASGLVDALTADLRAALSFVAVTARTLAADLARLAGGELPAAEARAAVERLVRDRGVAAVVYRDGSRYGLDTYAEMASRTKLAETWQVASFRLFAAAGVGWVEITDGIGCGWVSHDDPDKANGKIVTLDEALANPIAHPNCSRSSYPRLDVTSLEDAAGADPLGGGTLLDDGGPDVPSERGPGGLLSFRPPHMLAPAAARHAMVLARARARVSVGAGIAVGSQRLGSRPRRGPGSG